MPPQETEQGNPRLAGLPPGSALTEVVSRCLYRKPEARPALAELKAEFARQARHYGGRGQDDFGTFLPEPVMDLIRAWRYQLDEVTRARTQSRWDAPALAALPPDGTKVIDRTRQLVPDRNERQPAGSGTRIQPGTGRPQFSRPGHRHVRWEHQLADWVRVPVVVRDDGAIVLNDHRRHGRLPGRRHR